MKGYKKNKYNKKNINKGKIIALVILLVFSILFIFSVIKIINYIKDSKNNYSIMKKIEEDIEIVDIDDKENNAYKIDFKSLKNKNSDTCSFLKVKGTNIENIVVKAPDNNYYLAHNFEKKENSTGWLFADYRNKLDGKDKNVIIYGHNMKNNAMFGTLKNILNKEWQENKDNREIIFITEDIESIYDVFSVYQIKAEDYYMKIEFQEGEFKKYVDTMKKRSIYDFNVDVNDDDNILTLSTCGENSKNRIILHAKQIYISQNN